MYECTKTNVYVLVQVHLQRVDIIHKISNPSNRASVNVPDKVSIFQFHTNR